MQSLANIVGFSMLLMGQTYFLSTPVFAKDLQSAQIVRQGDNISRFVPQPKKSIKLDYSVLDEALSYVVVDLGPSLRSTMTKPQPSTGSRFVTGHDSMYRMEGSRVTIDYMTKEFLAGLSEYRRDLERIGTEIDITTLSRNEQLSYWFNLHNITVLEQLSLAYPVNDTKKIKLKNDGQKQHFEEAKLLTVLGEKLSLKDIRNIVYQNWKDPRVLYGFYRGNIGSPKISVFAFNSSRIEDLLNENAGEFVNSLRGFRRTSNYRNISALYRELEETHFRNFDEDINNHLRTFALDNTLEDLSNNRPFRFDPYHSDIGDLAKGKRINPASNAVEGNFVMPAEVKRFFNESNEKRKMLIQKGLITPRGGYVIIQDVIPEEDTQPIE